MKKTLLLAIPMLISGFMLQAQSLDEILKEHFAAVGQDKLVKVQNMKVSGKLVQMGLEIPFAQTIARPNSIRVEGTFQGLTFVQTYNGKEGWNLNPFGGQTEPQPFGEDEIKSVKYQADLDGMFWNYGEKNYTVVFDGKEDMEGTSCYKIKLTTKEGDEFTNYLDAESYLPIKTSSKVKVQGNEAEAETYYSNYMQVEGIAIAGKTETKMGGQVVNTIITEKVEFNLALDSTLFNKPVTK
jgi:hypothetical protein